MMRRFLAFVAFLALFAGSGRAVAGAVAYRCEMDGEVRSACCCEAEGRSNEGCCDVVISEDDRVDETVMPASPAWEAPAIPHLGIPAVEGCPWCASTILDRPGAPRGPPQRAGPLIYDEVCSWLI